MSPVLIAWPCTKGRVGDSPGWLWSRLAGELPAHDAPVAHCRVLAAGATGVVPRLTSSEVFGILLVVGGALMR
jgi:hypothetical protein